MNKQEAENYIIQQLGRNCSRDEIAQALSQELNAPVEIVSKFVARVAQEHSLSISHARSALPPEAPLPTYSGNPLEDSMPAPSQSIAERNFQYSASPNSNVSATPQTDPWMMSEPDGYDAEALEAQILQALRKDRRRSDIVMEVCETTGMSWDRAKRLVSQVATTNRKHLVSRQNMLIIPLTIIALLAGFTLIVASVSEGLEIARQIASAPSEIPAQTSEIEFILQEGLWGFVIGISLLLGGIYGLIRALQAHFE